MGVLAGPLGGGVLPHCVAMYMYLTVASTIPGMNLTITLLHLDVLVGLFNVEKGVISTCTHTTPNIPLL